MNTIPTKMICRIEYVITLLIALNISSVLNNSLDKDVKFHSVKHIAADLYSVALQTVPTRTDRHQASELIKG